MGPRQPESAQPAQAGMNVLYSKLQALHNQWDSSEVALGCIIKMPTL